MKINQRIVSKFQDGGAAPAGGAPQGGAPAPGGAPGGDPSQGGGGQDPVMQLAQLAQQALQSQDCQAALAVCQGFMSLIQSAQGGGGAPGGDPSQGGGAPGGAPAAGGGDPSQGGGQPVYRAGGRLVKRIKA